MNVYSSRIVTQALLSCQYLRGTSRRYDSRISPTLVDAIDFERRIDQ